MNTLHLLKLNCKLNLFFRKKYIKFFINVFLKQANFIQQ